MQFFRLSEHFGLSVFASPIKKRRTLQVNLTKKFNRSSIQKWCSGFLETLQLFRKSRHQIVSWYWITRSMYNIFMFKNFYYVMRPSFYLITSCKLDLCGIFSLSVTLSLKHQTGFKTPGVNFTNILCAAFTYVSFAHSFLVLAF